MSMNDNDLERLEAQLRNVSPARPPAAFLQRLKSETPALVAERRAHTTLALQPAQPENCGARNGLRVRSRHVVFVGVVGYAMAGSGGGDAGRWHRHLAGEPADGARTGNQQHPGKGR